MLGCVVFWPLFLVGVVMGIYRLIPATDMIRVLPRSRTTLPGPDWLTEVSSMDRSRCSNRSSAGNRSGQSDTICSTVGDIVASGFGGGGGFSSGGGGGGSW